MLSNGGSSTSQGTSNAVSERDIHEPLIWQALHPMWRR
jgi:hypothetical protein